MFIWTKNSLSLYAYSHIYFFLFFLNMRLMWLKADVKINNGNDQKALRKRWLISPSGNAIRNVMNSMPNNKYHLKQSVQSNRVMTIAHITM